MAKLQRFLAHEYFGTSLIKACVSSIPRWAFIQQMNKTRNPEDPREEDDLDSESEEDYEYVSAPSNLFGLARGQKAFLNSSRRILKGRDSLCILLVISIASTVSYPYAAQRNV